MKCCSSSSGCETRPAKGEPAQPVARIGISNAIFSPRAGADQLVESAGVPRAARRREKELGARRWGCVSLGCTPYFS
jgi:hypothetical protein